MARPGRIFLPLDVSYFDDGRVVELSDSAQLLDLRAMLLARRLQTDGRLSRAQFGRIAPSGGDVGAMVGDLVRVGLWTEDGTEFVRRAWAEWNDTAADIASMAKGGSWGNHLRWHQKRGVVKADCPHCQSGDGQGGIGSESPPESAPESKTRPDQTETRPDENGPDGGDPVDAVGVKANRVVVVVADRIAQTAARAGKVRGDVNAYASGVEERIRPKAFPLASRLAVEFPDDTIEELARKVTAEIEPGADGIAARSTVPLEESRYGRPQPGVEFIEQSDGTVIVQQEALA